MSGAEDAEAHAVAEPAAVPDAVRVAVEGDGFRIDCPSWGSAQVAHMLGDDGGVFYVCTPYAHSWS
ncbi:hypothetical protein M5362_06205 [Streptomyces sp. Je 1-79]|uniref:hypothetical protein n=1 Tax=Streptomyces sp. Je 1-79 TaxID=2943847 RepID=UPI0021A73D88|nr:hypothetical protein [Streptomyces sp. Je 1-79]MCT4352722.1 hypothetical protein [Streptomyces sp. Je 1-79]